MPAPRMCSECGRRIVAKLPAKRRNQRRGFVYKAKAHDLCQKCWVAEKNRNQNK